MGQVNFEEVEGFDVPGTLNAEKLELPEEKSGQDSDLVTEHIYIVFSKNISIEDGIKTIEEKVLSGNKLDVRRTDENGHAVVAVVSASQREQISGLSEVERVKVEEAANPLEGAAGSDEGTANPLEGATGSDEGTANPLEGATGSVEDNAAPSKDATESEQVSETDVAETEAETEVKNEAENNVTSEISNDTETETESAEEGTLQEEEESVETSITVYPEENGGKKGSTAPFTGITVATVLVLVAALIAILLRRK